jgi:hypothetical protein
MRSWVLASGGLATVLLAGCLEVEQHPGWIEGAYDGKRDQLPERAHFAGSRLAWNAAITDRTRLQNEYQRTDRGEQR